MDAAATGAMQRVVQYIIDPALLVIFALGFLLFVYGLIEFLWKLNEGGDNAEGKRHMVWGIVGMVVMLSVYGIINLITGTFNIDYKNPDVGRLNDIQINADPFGR